MRELADELARVSRSRIEVPIERTHGTPTARGAAFEVTQVHSVRLPGYVIAFEAVFGLPDERLTPRGREGERIARTALAELEREWAETVGQDRFAMLRATLEDLVISIERQG